MGWTVLAISDHRSSQPTFDELARLASEAHVGGMLSGKAGVPDALEAAQLGVCGFLEKPLTKQALLAAVAEAVDIGPLPRAEDGRIQTVAGELVYRSAVMQDHVVIEFKFARADRQRAASLLAKVPIRVGRHS